MLNKVIITGRLTADPEIRSGSTGKHYCSFSIACERDYKDRDGKRETDFFDVRAFSGTADFLERNFKKGSLLQIEGRLQLNVWKDGEGVTHRSVGILAQNIYFCGGKRESGEANAAPEPEFVPLDSEEELPF